MREPVSNCARGRRLMSGAGLAGLAAAALFGVGQARADAQPVTPAEAPPSDVAEVVVTGLRASLERSIDTKRRSDVIVDSISSEDLGRFPDSNVAEALQRITGVSIDRSAGEGRFVTVRGFGPQFNELLLNGRTLATENPGRQFSFDLLPAELISGADVFKTVDASLQEGGIGSTINLRTPRPFDIRGQRIILSAKGEYEDLSQKASPEVFGLYSNTFLDGRLGVLASVSYQQRQARIDQAVDDGYYLTPTAGALKNVYVPQDYNQISDSQNRERTNITGVLQYRATDSLTFTLDGIYNKFNVESVANQVGHFFSPSDFSNVTADANGTVTAFNQSNAGHTDFVSRTFNRPTELKAFGLNAAWTPSDRLKVTFDSSYSQATNDGGGGQVFAVIGFNNPLRFDAAGSGLPNITTQNSITDPSVGRAHFLTKEGFDTAETVYEQRFNGEYKTGWDFLTSIRFGGIYTDRTKTNDLIRSDANAGCVYCGYGIPVASGLLQPFNAGNFLGGESGTFPRVWQQFDPNAYFAFLSTQAAANAEDVAAGRPLGASYRYLQSVNFFTPVLYPASYRVGEQVAGGYLQTDFKGELGGRPWAATLGVRYVHTELQSKGQQQTLTDLLTIPGDTTSYTAVYSPGTPPVARKTSYDDVLPTFNAKMDLRDDVVVRFAVSQTLTRPNLTDLAPQISYTNLRPGNLQASGGNPELNPYKATNLDGSFEWYYQKAGFFTVGLFYKDLSDFIVNGVGTEVFTLSPGAGTAFPGGSASFNVRRPRNVGSSEVYGAEIGFQHSFTWLPAPFDGLGITANATFVDSSGGNASSATGSSFALEGLGNSYNLIGFYAKGPWEVRLAFNHRDGFLSTQANGTGGLPIYTRTADQLDFQARYNITKNLSVLAQGINVNNAKTETYGAYENQFLSLIETGPRYFFGVRAQF